MKFKIILINFPFDDLSQTKLRPALCLTDLLTKNYQVILSFISTQIQTCNQTSDFIINDSLTDFHLTELRQTSAIRLHRLITISDQLIIKVIGQLPLQYHPEIYSRLNKLFFNKD
jgi:mRNA interferase MazF